jgi:mycothiol synthase
MTTSKPSMAGVAGATSAAETGSAAAPAGATPTTVPGLLLRPVRWPEEAATLNDINNAGRIATGNLEVLSVEGILNSYAHLVHCDLGTDLRIAVHDGRPVAYVRVEWRDETRGGRHHFQGLFTRPDAPAGTLETILDWAEARSMVVAGDLPPTSSTTIGAFLNEETAAHRATIEGRGYRPVRFFFGMVRPTLDDIPDLPLPPGVEVRPVRPEDVRAIFEAEVAAFAGHWGASTEDGGEDRWRAFRDEPLNDLALWQVAWAGDTVVGMVRPYINPPDLEVLGVRRGWCENISTHADWRGRGIAKALIARALVALRDRGMTEAALGVDADNETGALGVYHAMGFEERTRETDFRKPFPVAPEAAR